MYLLELRDISHSFGDEVIINNFSLQVESGQKWVIQAPSGKGKTTLLHIILGFIKQDSGEIKMSGKTITDENIHQLRREVSWLPQDFQLGEGIVRDVILKPFEFKINKTCQPANNEINRALNKIGLHPGILDKRFSDISEGQKQRVGMVICTLIDRKIILMDEPTSALDTDTKEKVIELFLKDKDLTVISTSHDTEWIKHCEKIMHLK